MHRTNEGRIASKVAEIVTNHFEIVEDLQHAQCLKIKEFLNQIKNQKLINPFTDNEIDNYVKILDRHIAKLISEFRKTSSMQKKMKRIKKQLKAKYI